MAAKTFKAGDKVNWNSTQGKVAGTVAKNLRAPMDDKTHPAAASLENPQLRVKSAAAGPVAAHKPTALKRVNAK